MGEQRPMGTLRGFLKGTHHKDDQFYSRPYELTTASGQPNYELRRFTTSERTGDQDDDVPYRMRTDFFELYWAHYFDTGDAQYTWKWIRKNTFKKPFWRHIKQVRLGIAVLQLLVLLFPLTVLVTVLTPVRGWEIFGWGTEKTLAILIGICIVEVLIGTLLSSFLREVLSDPPRYLIPEPKHVRARNEIRDEGVRLLREIHERDYYERVVVVGHSLGSIVGLDILRLAWEEYRHPDPYLQSQNPARDAELALRFDDIIRKLPNELTPDQMRTWQDTQHQLWQECRRRGMKWLVTDFITLSSPLAHADWLMFDGPQDMKKSFKEREYPTCPPDVGRGIFYGGKYKDAKAGRTVNPDALVPHHAALFAVTRWSNAYFPAYRWYGDPVGGDVAATFGRGIRDVKVRVKSCKPGSLRQVLGVAHLSYWNRYLDPDWDCPESDTAIIQARERMDRRTGTRVAHLVLQEFLHLDFKPLEPSEGKDTTVPSAPSVPEMDLPEPETLSPAIQPVPAIAAGNVIDQVAASMMVRPHASGEDKPSDTLADAAVAEIPVEDIPPPIPEIVSQKDMPKQTPSDQPPAPV
ncbi:hypothetical protein HMPREF0290_1635 [Corynebacterium efficiens YS-314]|nr:hypothetical protein [Corynebacterium efficiens]EEW49712.1 hypothetical protein HMPREF0290_1635 [Corynebacterium efficiens YS-314]